MLINFDGVGRNNQRIIIETDPDTHGPFSAYLDSWFDEVAKAVDYGQKKVCFRELYFQYLPGYPWIWENWSQSNTCAETGPSPMYQSFSLFLRDRWKAKYGPSTLPAPPSDEVHVVLEVREVGSKKGYSGEVRAISNLEEVITAIRKIPHVKLTVQHFARLPFHEQVALSHSAGVFVSMHGAGTANIFHSAVGSPNCCALVELFPDKSTGFHTIYGFGNIARHMGMHYFRYEAQEGESSSSGTKVDVEVFSKIVENAVTAVMQKPSCVDSSSSGKVVDILSPSVFPLGIPVKT